RFVDTGRVSWLSDGSGIIVNAAEQGANQDQIWEISYPGGEARPVTHDLSDYGGTSLTADSKLLVTVPFDATENIWIAPAEDLMHGKQITSGKREGAGLAWTKDNKIVFASLAPGNWDLWL